MEYINLNPHPLSIYHPDTPDAIEDPDQGLMRVIDPTQPMARLTTEEGEETLVDGVLHLQVTYGSAKGLPSPRVGVLCVVSLVTGLALAGTRGDLLVPYREVRALGRDGRPGAVLGCRAFAVPRLAGMSVES